MHSIIQSNARRKVDQVCTFIGKNDRVLDFGCGDLSFAKQLHVSMPTLHINAVDVVDFGIRDTHISFTQYDGYKLPFKTGSFDTVIIYHVLHHTTSPEALFRECLRVSKNTVLLVEPVYRFRLEILGMSCMDWIFNVWKYRSISMAFSFRSKNQWQDSIKKAGWRLTKIVDVEMLPWWLPTGRSYLFVCKL